MKTKYYHVSNMGSYAQSHLADTQGYVLYHDSPRYRRATEAQLSEWSESRIKAVRHAAITEQAQRALRRWQGRPV